MSPARETIWQRSGTPWQRSAMPWQADWKQQQPRRRLRRRICAASWTPLGRTLPTRRGALPTLSCCCKYASCCQFCICSRVLGVTVHSLANKVAWWGPRQVLLGSTGLIPTQTNLQTCETQEAQEAHASSEAMLQGGHQQRDSCTQADQQVSPGRQPDIAKLQQQVWHAAVLCIRKHRSMAGPLTI